MPDNTREDSGELDPNVRDELESASSDDGPTIEFYGGKWMSALPITLFIVWAIVQSGILRVGGTPDLVIGMVVSLTVGMVFVKGDWANYANTIFEGMTQRVAATAIVAWIWAGMFAETLQAGGFVSGLVWAADVLEVGATLFPAITFVLAALLATGIGTGYGTTVAFSALFFPAGIVLGASPVLMFGAILSGAVFGDNLAPVSDTTIVSAVTQDSDIGGVVASRFKYAIVAASLAFVAYIFASASMPGIDIAGASGLFANANPAGLVHLISMGVVIFTAVRGRHIVEAISWGLFAAIAFNLVFGLSTVNDIYQGLYGGVTGFFPLIVLTLAIVAGARIMIRGGGFQAIQDWLLDHVATNVRRAETTMVLGTALVNAMITINTAAEIAIAPYIARIGQRFNINGYRRANILDANTSALGYIFPWAGGVLVGYATLQGLPQEYTWFTPEMVVNPAEVWPFVFHGWLLFAVFLVSALTGFGLEYVSDRRSEEVTRV